MGLSVGSIAFSGIQAGIKRVHVAGDNMARREVPNSSKNRVVQTTGEQGGVETTIQKIPYEGPSFAEDETISNLATNIDYAEQIIEQTLAETAFNMSIRVYETDNKMQKSLVNIKV